MHAMLGTFSICILANYKISCESLEYVTPSQHRMATRIDPGLYGYYGRKNESYCQDSILIQYNLSSCYGVALQSQVYVPLLHSISIVDYQSRDRKIDSSLLRSLGAALNRGPVSAPGVMLENRVFRWTSADAMKRRP